MNKKDILIKCFIVLGIIILGISLGMGTYYLIVNKNNNTNNSDNEVNTKPENLYEFNYFSEGGGYYQAIIDSDYNFWVAKIEDISKYDNHDNIELIVNDLSNMEHKEKITLNEKQKLYVKEVLNNLDYNIDDLSNIEYYNIYDYPYIIKDLKSGKSSKYQKGTIIALYNAPLFYIALAFVENDTSYLDYMVNNNALKYIKDKDYKPLYSNLIEELYNKVSYNYHGYIMNSYEENRITNNSIIILTLQEMEKRNLGEMWHDEFTSYIDFDMAKFDDVAKELFEPDVKYNLDEYSGRSLYQYKSHGDDFTTEDALPLFTENIFSEISYAYETEDKIVIIEKTLFVIDIEGYYASKYDLKKGLYNNLSDRKLISDNIDEVEAIMWNNFEKMFQKYDNESTYYAYTFTKDNGNYYFTNFEKLN